MRSLLRAVLTTLTFLAALSDLGGTSAQAQSRDALREQISDDVVATMRGTYQLNSENAEKFSGRLIDAHLRSTGDFYPLTTYMRVNEPNQLGEIRSSLRYMKVASKPVRFHASKVGNATLIEVRIHIKNLTTAETPEWAGKLSMAADVWKRSNPRYVYNREMDFQFRLVRTEEEAHFSIRLQDDTRGPYDQSWDRNWKVTTVAHEIGHMMGLKDEYDYLVATNNTRNCFERSIMCHAEKGYPLQIHYYFILRQLYAPVSDTTLTP